MTIKPAFGRLREDWKVKKLYVYNLPGHYDHIKRNDLNQEKKST